MARTFVTPQWVFLCLVCAQYLNVFANIITHPLRVTIASYFCQRLQQLLSLNVFHHYASRCSRRDMQPEPTHARRKPMQPIPVTKVSCQENNIQELTYDEHWSSARRNSGSWMLLAIFIFFVRSKSPLFNQGCWRQAKMTASQNETAIFFCTWRQTKMKHQFFFLHQRQAKMKQQFFFWHLTTNQNETATFFCTPSLIKKWRLGHWCLRARALQTLCVRCFRS